MSSEKSSSDKPAFRRLPQQKRSQARLEAILKAAAEVFWEVGYDAATTHAIARRASTAVGTLYRFFPNKLSIFQELEKRHRQGVEETHARMMTPEFVQQSLASMVRQIVETYARYFEDLGHRVVYIQYYVSPEMFIHFDESVDHGFIRRFAVGLRMNSSSLSVEKSELIAEVCHRSFNALLLSALRSEAGHRTQLYQELQTLLINYLRPYIEPRDPLLKSDSTVTEQVATATQSHSLNTRQQTALTQVLEEGHLTIQEFEKLCPERSRRTLQRDLKQLVEKGLLKSEGDTTQLVYTLAETLNAL